MIRRLTLCAVFALALVGTPSAHAQFANHTGNVVGTVGGTCSSSINDYAWPDTNGDILKCVSNVWTLVTQPATAAGSTGYVQFDNAGTLAASANLFWDNTNFRLGIGTTVPLAKLDVSPGYTQTANVTLSTRGQSGSGNAVEWGHTNQSGYGNTLGWQTGSGQPFLCFDCEAGSTGNTFRTRGIKGALLESDLAGGFIFATVPTATADNQTATNTMIITTGGNVGIGTTTPGATLSVNGGAVVGSYGGNGTAAPSNGLIVSGSVGIGTTVPLQPLEVTGNILINGNDGTGELMLGSCCQSTLYRASSDGSLHIVSGQANIDLTPVSNVIVTQGNVGIGTTSPVGLLSVNLASASGNVGAWDNTYATFGAAGSTTGSAVGIGYNSSLDFGEIRSAAPGTSWKDLYIRGKNLLFFYQNGSGATTEGMRIVSGTGNVGIGTTAPGAPLEVRGASGAEASNAGNLALTTAGSTNGLRLGVDDSTYAWIQSFNSLPLIFNPGGSNVGIGTTVPQGALDVDGGSGSGVAVRQTGAPSSSFTLAGLYLGGTGSYGWLQASGSSSNNPLVFNSNGGNVGIGTTVPGAKLDVEGTGGVNVFVGSTDATTASVGYVEALADSSELFVASHSSARTVSRYGLTLGGWTEISAFNNTGTTNGLVIGAATAKPLVFGTNSAERMRIDSSGNVGIGTSVPGTKLDVNGALTMRGMSAPSVSASGQSIIYFDSTANVLKISQNGAAYSPLSASCRTCAFECTVGGTYGCVTTAWVCSAYSSGNVQQNTAPGGTLTSPYEFGIQCQ